jgi:hypothetical protein
VLIFNQHLFVTFKTYGCSSIGRVVVSKTIGWEFESLHPCRE